MTSTHPMMTRGIFGLSERDLPAAGFSGTAVWPVIESDPTRRGAGAITRVRRHLAWWSMRRSAHTVEALQLVDPPMWASWSVHRRRAKAGLEPATIR